MKSSGKHIININCALKGIKTDTFINFICSDYHSLIVISNKVVSPSNLEVVERYVKNVNSVDSNDVQSIIRQVYGQTLVGLGLGQK